MGLFYGQTRVHTCVIVVLEKWCKNGLKSVPLGMKFAEKVGESLVWWKIILLMKIQRIKNVKYGVYSCTRVDLKWPTAGIPKYSNDHERKN